MRRLFSLILLLCLLTIPALSVYAQTTLTVGATPIPHAEILEFVKPLLAEEGIDLRIVVFTDYIQPNLLLADGDLDANFFQHIPYLETFSKDHRLNLSSLVAVHIEPMGLYSQRVSSLDALPTGAQIAIPNDPTNGGRALLLLASHGLISLRSGVGLEATELDVVNNPKRLRFIPLEAPMLPRALADVHAAVINTNYALEAGLDPLKDSLIIEGASSPYANVVAVRTEDIDSPVLKKFAEILTSDPVRTFIEEKYNGAVVPVF